MSKTFDVCIRGDGVVGRTLALLLAQERLKVARVAKPVATPKRDIRAYALNSTSKKLLESLRVWPEGLHATPVQNIQVWGDDGGALEFNTAQTGEDALTWIVDVPQLESQLLQACGFQSLIEVVSEPATAALNIICEGQTSSSRSALPTQWTRKVYAQTAIAARLETDTPHNGAARQWFNGGQASGEVVALLPLGGALGNSLALVWSVNDERAKVLENLPNEEFCAALSAACQSKVGALRLTSERGAWPLALSSAEQWVGTGWALAGDAAHTVHPLAGQGLNLGLADAQCLSRVLASREYWRGLGDEKLLRRYERARKADVAAVGAVTDSLYNLFAQTSPAWQSARNWGMNGLASSSPLKTWLTKRAAGLPL